MNRETKRQIKEDSFNTICAMVKSWAFKDRMQCDCEAARMKNKLDHFNELLDILREYYDMIDEMEEDEMGERCPYAE